jgi:hypothetical protein
MTLADHAAITGHDGQVTGGQPARPKRQTFTAAYKARILAASGALLKAALPCRRGNRGAQVWLLAGRTLMTS